MLERFIKIKLYYTKIIRKEHIPTKMYFISKNVSRFNSIFDIVPVGNISECYAYANNLNDFMTE